MAKYKTRTVDSTIENNIITAAIISTYYLEEIFPLYNPDYLRNKFAKIVMNWVLDYFEKFGEAPKETIQSIFDIEKGNLEDAELSIIESFLVKLNNNYTEGQGINEEYVLDQTMSYFRKREVEYRVEMAQKFIDVGKHDKAEEELIQMKKVVRLTSNWCNPLSPDEIQEVFDERSRGIFRFPGAMGDIFGDLERGWFIAILAPFKRGKTWLLQEAVVQSAFSNLKAVFISLEMKNKNLKERIYKRITAFGDENKDWHAIPVFDCVRNQNDTCANSKRCNQISLMDEDGQIPEFNPELEYRVCDICRGTDEYIFATWYETVSKPTFNHKNVSKKLKSFSKFYGDNIRIKCYPRFSASLADIKRDLDLLEQTEGFIPDVIAIDYADILKPEGRNKETRNDIDDIWKNMAALAGERGAIVFSASQGNRGSIYKENMDQADLAEWIGKLGHVDKFVSVNQSGDEKRKGIIRIGMLADRHKEFHEKDQVVLLQALNIGQVHLDSMNKRVDERRQE